MNSLIVGRSDGSVPLLAGSIPDLKFERDVVLFNAFDLEIDANSGLETKLKWDYLYLKILSQKRRIKQDFPTEVLPMSSIL